MLTLLSETGRRFNQKNMPSYAAAIAYHAIISLAPLLLFSISAAGLFYGEELAIDQLVKALSDAVGVKVAELIGGIAADLSQPTLNNLLFTIVWFFVTLYTASNVFRQLVTALDTIWDVAYAHARLRDGVIRWCMIRLRKYFLGVGMALMVITSLLVSLFVSVLSGNFWRLLDNVAPELAPLVLWSSSVIIPLVLIGFCLLVFKILPNRQIAWRDIWQGAVLTGGLLALAEGIIGFYASRSRIPTFYGLAGSVVVLMLWAYFSAFVLLIGAVFTRVYAERHGTLYALDQPVDSAKSL